MSGGAKWDMTSKHSLDAAAEWVRKGSGALLVLVVRAEDMSFAVDSQIAPADAVAMVDFVLPELKEQLAAERTIAKEDAERKRKDAPERCVCARLWYRNLPNGDRQTIVKGEANCQLCQGYGFVLQCVTCSGCGLKDGQKCPECYGHGKLPNRKAQAWVA